MLKIGQSVSGLSAVAFISVTRQRLTIFAFTLPNACATEHDTAIFGINFFSPER